MRLDESCWIFSGGDTADWRWVRDRRAALAREAFERIAAEYERRAPRAAREAGYGDGLRFFAAGGPSGDRLLLHPAFDYWLYLWEKHFSLPCDDLNWHLQFGLFQGFAATLALEAGRSFDGGCFVEDDGHLHLYGSPWRVELPASCGLKPARLRVSRAGLEVEAAGGARARIPRGAFEASAAPSARFGRARLARGPLVGEGICVDDCGLLLTQGVVMHGLDHPGPAQAERFASVLRRALDLLRDDLPAVHFELRDLVRVLVPLENPRDYGSVSSSYVNMRGMIALSHSDDAILQVETLLHEFCHQKINQLALVEPILLPGQGGQVFYSPWRADARRLRGLLLGAHAFLNVARFLTRALTRERLDSRKRVAMMVMVVRRLTEVQTALDTASAYGSFTEFGQRFVLGMRREAQHAFHAIQWFPAQLVKEGQAACAAHRAKHCLPLTGFHKSAEALLPVETARFGDRRPEAA